MTDSIAYLGLIDEEDVQLDAAALELAALDHPEVDLAVYAERLSTITERLADLGSAARASADQARILARVIGVEHGFDGDRTSYDDPANADLIRVMDRRRGLPVSLAILYVAAARRVGWSADALNTPGHVLVRIGADTAPVIVDPFNGGREVSAAQLEALVAQATGRGEIRATHVAAMPNRAVLTRLLLNQAGRAEAGGDPARARILYERITAFAPADAHARWQATRLALAEGEVEPARAGLVSLLEMTRDPELRARVQELLQHIAAAS